MPLTAKCPVCSTTIEYGEEWIGKTYKCECGVMVNLTAPEPKTIPPGVSEYLEKWKGEPKEHEGPSLAIAWGWTWRVFVCLIPIGFILWIVCAVIWAIVAHDADMLRQSQFNSQPIGR